MVSQCHCKIFHETQNPPYSTKNKYSLVNCPTIVCTKKHVLYLSPGVWFFYPMELLNNYLPSQLHQPGKKNLQSTGFIILDYCIEETWKLDAYFPMELKYTESLRRFFEDIVLVRFLDLRSLVHLRYHDDINAQNLKSRTW
jgi:hypothetical protein